MKRFFMLVSLVIACLLLFSACFAETMYAVCDDGSSVNIRLKANKHSQIIGYLLNGYDIEVISISNGWAYVRCGCEYEYGYVREEYLSSDAPMEPVSMTVISDGRVIIRETAGGKATGRFVYNGDRLTVTACKSGYARTEKGWVSMAFLKEEK